MWKSNSTLNDSLEEWRMGFNSVLKLVTAEAVKHNLRVGNFFRNLGTKKYEVHLTNSWVYSSNSNQEGITFKYEIEYPEKYRFKKSVINLIRKKTLEAKTSIEVGNRLLGISERKIYPNVMNNGSITTTWTTS